MVRLVPIAIEIHASETLLSSPIPLALGLFISATLLVALCAKHATQRHRSKAKQANKISPKQLVTSSSHKAKKPGAQEPDAARVNDEEIAGVWQKAIMMGERCQPPEFSGVIYYDYSGNRISEMPKSPRATSMSPSMSPLRSFNFHVEKNDDSVQ